MANRKNIVLLIAGEGGHFEQMDRLVKHLKFTDNTDKIYLVTDTQKREINLPNVTVLALGEIRSKDGFSILNAAKYFYQNTIAILQVIYGNNVKTISTGPGIAIYPSILCKLFAKSKVVHIETWSRFYTQSMTGKIMYKIANKFYLQNKELKNVYPNGIYSGRL